MNEYKIYQVRREFLAEFGYWDLRQIRMMHPGMQGLPREAWEQVYVYRTEKEPSLDWLYMLFNRGIEPEPGIATPEDFTGHSLSVSDIVETPSGKLWFCASSGWREVQWAEEAEG